MRLSVKDAASLLSVTEKTIYRWIKQDVLPAYKVRGCYRFNRAELLDWATSRRLGVAVEAYSEPDAEAQPVPALSTALAAGGIFYRIGGETRDAALADAVQHLRLPEEVDRRQLLQMLIGREKLASTAVGAGIALPHPRSPGLLNVVQPTLTLCFLERPVDFQALDGQPVSILLLIISPHLRAHLHLLSRLGFVLHDPEFRAALRAEESREKLLAALTRAEAKIRS